MSAPVYATVLELLDHLTVSEQHALFEYLQQRLPPLPLSQAEFEAALQAMTLDMGPVSPDYSDRREDWYGDDGR